MIWLLALLLVQSEPSQTEDAFVVTQRTSTYGEVQHALRDADGDGDLDLFAIRATGVDLTLLESTGRYADEVAARFSWPHPTLGWDLADLDGDGRVELALLVPEQGVFSVELNAAGVFGEPERVLHAEPWLPPGRARVDFARDIDGDGRTDLVLPTARSHRIHIGLEPGRFAAPLDIDYDVGVSLSVGDPDRLNANFGRSVSIPWFTIQDVDGDGRVDLVSETKDRIAFHLAAEGLASEPSWTLDLADLRAGLVETKGIDLDDLLANVPDSVDWRVADLDGSAPNELIVAVGPTLRVYTGGARTGPTETPDQILKTSGKLLAFFVRDVLGDERPDLQLLRGERISLGRALRYLILPGRLDFEIFTYRNEGGLFGRRPAQRGTFGLRIPRLLSFMEQAEAFGEGLEERFDVPAARFAFDEDGEANDVVDLDGSRLIVTKDCAPGHLAFEGLLGGDVQLSRLMEALFLEELDARGDGAEFVIDIERLHTYPLSPSAALRTAAHAGAVASSTPFAEFSKSSGLRVLDLDGDGRDDVVAWGKRESDSEEWTLGFFVRR
ncbi:MAG: VCBS repeat-containing protein [Planctomycetota bacterium]